MEINIVPKFIDNGLTPIAKEAGERLADIINLAFTPIIKMKAVRDTNLKMFVKQLEKRLEAIPAERIVEPPLEIAGAALDNVGRYYHDNEQMRTMFANLIASSMDKEKQGKIHPSYIDLISELSPMDARILTLKTKGIYTLYTIKSDRKVIAAGNDIRLYEEFIHCTSISPNVYDSTVALQNLQRLNLVELRKIRYEDIDEGDEDIYLNPIYDLHGDKLGISVSSSFKDKQSLDYFSVILTTYGREFLNVCTDKEFPKTY